MFELRVRDLPRDSMRPMMESPTERAELAAFFRELGLGWEVDAEGLVDRIAGRGAEP
jgi:hypothetical protein